MSTRSSSSPSDHSSANTLFEKVWARPLRTFLRDVSQTRIAERAAFYATPRLILQPTISDDGRSISASIAGSAAKPYQTVLRIDDGKLKGECSCPYDGRCKHMAALAMLLGWEARRMGYPQLQDRELFPSDWTTGRGGPPPYLIANTARLFAHLNRDGSASPFLVQLAPPQPENVKPIPKRRTAPAPVVSETSDPPALPWWRKYLDETDGKKRLEILTRNASLRTPGSSWAAMHAVDMLKKIENPVQVLREFEQVLSRYAAARSLAPDEAMHAFLNSAEGQELWERYEQQLAEKRLLGWLNKETEDDLAGQTLGSGRMDVVWDQVPVHPGISALVCRVFLQKVKGGLTARTAQSLWTAVGAMDREGRSYGAANNRFLRWLTNLSAISSQRYSSYSASPEDDRTALPVSDIFLWMSMWGNADLLRWHDGGSVRFSPNSARLTLQPAGSESLQWMIEIPGAGDTPSAEIQVRDARILVESEGHGTPRWPQPRVMVRLGDTLHLLDTNGMPYDVLATLSARPELPVNSVRGTKAGLHLARRLLRSRAGTTANPFLQEVPVKPVVELRLSGATLMVSAVARTEDGSTFVRIGPGVWEPQAETTPQAPPDSAVLPDLPEEQLPNSEEQTDAPPPVAEPAPQAELSAMAIATLPSPADVQAIDEWIEKLPSPGSHAAALPGPAYGQSWVLTAPGLIHLLEQWIKRPRGVEYRGDKEFRNLIQVRRVPKFSVQIESSGIDWLGISVETENELEELSLSEVLDALTGSSSPLVLLRGGRVFKREELEQWKKEVEGLAAFGLAPAAGKQQLHALQLAGVPAEALQELEAISPNLRQLATSAKEVVQAFEGIPHAPIDSLPAGFLRPYQRAGADFLVWAGATFGGAILADDMGLGKTLQILAALTALRKLATEEFSPTASAAARTKRNARAKPPRTRKSLSAGAPVPSEASAPLPPSRPLQGTLVVCPASVAHNWQREAARFTPGLRVLVLESGPERQEHLRQLHDYDLVVVNYVLLRREAKALAAHQWLAVVADEAQAIKNPRAEVTRAMRTLDARYRFAVTGTPIENRILDLWSIVDFALPGYLASLDPSAATSSDPVTAVRFYQLLRARLRPVLLRRMKAEVAPELPERIETRLDCNMLPRQRKLYLAELKRARGVLQTSSGEVSGPDRIQILAALTRLRQICCDPRLLGHREVGSAKVDALLELLVPLLESGHKVLVFSQFVTMLNHLRQELTRAGIKWHLLTGQTTKRHQVIAEFEQSPEPCVFLISLKAGGTGLNLVSATHVVLFDPWWNPAVEAQAIDRTHRIGQDKTVVAYRLVTEQSIEERILELQQHKLALVQNVLEEDSFNRTLSKADLEYLLADPSLSGASDESHS